MRMVLIVFLLIAASLAWAQSPEAGLRKGLCRRARSGGCRSGREVQIGRRLRHDDAGRPRLVRGLRPGEKQSRSRAAARHGAGAGAQGLFRRRHVQPRRAVLRAGRRHARRPPVPERQRQRPGDDGGPPATLAERAQGLVEGRSSADRSQGRFAVERLLYPGHQRRRGRHDLCAAADPCAGRRQPCRRRACNAVQRLLLPAPVHRGRGRQRRTGLRRAGRCGAPGNDTRRRAARRLRCRLEGFLRQIQGSRCGLRSGEGDLEGVRAARGREAASRPRAARPWTNAGRTAPKETARAMRPFPASRGRPRISRIHWPRGDPGRIGRTKTACHNWCS